VSHRSVAVASRCIGVGEIDKQASSCSNPTCREFCERTGQLVDRLGVADLRKGIATPSVEVGAAEEQERQRRVDRIGWKKCLSIVECPQSAVPIA
jgi:hypothetical protein